MSFPGIKQAVCDSRENISYSLVYHCLHSMGEKLPEGLKKLADRWTPLDTLRVTSGDSESYQSSLDAFFSSATSRNQSHAEMAEQLVRVHERALDERQDILKIALPPSLIEAGFTQWCESAVSCYLTLQIKLGHLLPAESKSAMETLKDSVATQVGKGGDAHRISSTLSKDPYFASRVSECYPELSLELIKKNWTSCTRFLLKKFNLKPLCSSSEADTSIDYDELKLVQPGTEHWKKCLCTFGNCSKSVGRVVH